MCRKYWSNQNLFYDLEVGYLHIFPLFNTLLSFLAVLLLFFLMKCFTHEYGWDDHGETS